MHSQTAHEWVDIILIRGRNEIDTFVNLAGMQPQWDLLVTAANVSAGVVAVWFTVKHLRRWHSRQ